MIEGWNSDEVFALNRATLARDDTIREAKTALIDAFKELASSEALFRATMSERLESRAQARFWVDVYLSIIEDRGRS